MMRSHSSLFISRLQKIKEIFAQWSFIPAIIAGLFHLISFLFCKIKRFLMHNKLFCVFIILSLIGVSNSYSVSIQSLFYFVMEKIEDAHDIFSYHNVIHQDFFESFFSNCLCDVLISWVLLRVAFQKNKEMENKDNFLPQYCLYSDVAIISQRIFNYWLEIYDIYRYFTPVIRLEQHPKRTPDYLLSNAMVYGLSEELSDILERLHQKTIYFKDKSIVEKSAFERENIDKAVEAVRKDVNPNFGKYYNDSDLKKIIDPACEAYEKKTIESLINFIHIIEKMSENILHLHDITNIPNRVFACLYELSILARKSTYYSTKQKQVEMILACLMKSHWNNHLLYLLKWSQEQYELKYEDASMLEKNDIIPTQPYDSDD